MGIGLKPLCLIAGAVLTVVGVCINNWKVATIGNSVVLAGLILF